MIELELRRMERKLPDPAPIMRPLYDALPAAGISVREVRELIFEVRRLRADLRRAEVALARYS